MKMQIEIDLYNLVRDAVERGIAIGYMHAHKHDDNPSEGVLSECIENDIMNEICTYIHFPMIGEREALES